MRTLWKTVVFAAVLLAFQVHPVDAQQRRSPRGRVQKIEIVKEHPKNYNATVGDVLQFYVAFAVVPGQMIDVDDVKTKVTIQKPEKHASLIEVGVRSTYPPGMVGGGEISAFFYARSPGTSYITFAPIPGHSKEPIRVAVVVREREERKPKE
ncbi:MAG: hypothetical protein HQ567_26610 [Candidatus Nealsonbacteria bacterium]|nr:hypothetical protein [Candidatus Nealsonbacteria bacterium]